MQSLNPTIEDRPARRLRRRVALPRRPVRRLAQIAVELLDRRDQVLVRLAEHGDRRRRAAPRPARARASVDRPVPGVAPSRKLASAGSAGSTGSRPSQPKATAGVRVPPALTTNRRVAPLPHRRVSPRTCAGTSSRAARLPIRRLEPARALRPARARARSRTRSRRPARRAAAAPASVLSACRSSAARSPSTRSGRDGQPGRGAVPAVALELVGGGGNDASRSKPGSAAPIRSRPVRVQRDHDRGRWWRSTIRDATIPTTPGCQPSPATTSIARSPSSRRPRPRPPT